MSLLQALQNKKKFLKSAETIITCADGQRLLESKDGITKLPQSSCGFVVDTKPDDIPAKIIEYLYLGSQDCCSLDVLQKYNITHVLSVGVDMHHKHDNITYKFVACLDLPETQIAEILEDCVPFVDSAVRQCSNVLVHCNAGVSRSSSVIIGYLMLKHHLSYAEAYGLVKQARKCVKPNSGFEQQLKNLN